MKQLALILLLASGIVGSAQISYWWSQELKKPDAKQSQEFFFVPGQGIFFTYQTNRVIINATGGGGGGSGITTNVCVTTCLGTTNVLSFSNGVLVAVSGPAPPSGNFLIQPAGLGFLLIPGGGKIALP